MEPSSRRPLGGIALVVTLASAMVGSSVVWGTAAAAAGEDLVISEVYGGGGNSGATYTHDFIELHNPTGVAVSVEGMSVQYRSASATATAISQVTALSGSVPAGGHYLVQEARGMAGTTPLPTPAATGSIPMSATGGVVFLSTSTEPHTPATGDVSDDGDPLLVDLVGFGAANTFENAGTPEAAGTPAPSNTLSVARAASGTDTDDNSADFVTAVPSPTSSSVPDPDPEPEPTELAIAAIQGDGFSSPVVGATVTTSGVVVAAYPTGGINGLFLSTSGTGTTPDSTPDASDGIFVYGPATLAAMTGGVGIGDHVEVTGLVSERFGLTTISPAAATDIVDSAETAPVLPTETTWPETNAAREALEGMLLAPQGSFTVSDNYSLNQYAEIGLAQGTEPLRQPTDVAPFGSDAATAQAAQNAARAVTLDDGATVDYLSDANEDTQLPWLTDDPTIRVGDPAQFVRPVVLDYGFGKWRFQPTAQLTAGDANAVKPATFEVTTRPASPEAVGGDLQVASFNVLNYFTDVGVDLTGCTFYTERDETDPVSVRGGCDARGAAEREDLERQEAKIVNAINALGAEVVSLSEIENSAKFGRDRDASLAALVSALNAKLGKEEWAFVPTPADAPDPAGEDFIRNAFIYKPAAVSLVGDSAIRPSGDGDPFVNARDPLAQVFAPVGAVESDRFMLVVNHFKSKGSPPSDPSDPNRDYGQGAWNVRRTEQAAALAAWVEQLQAANGVAKVYLDGDFNSYTYEDPMLALYAEGYTNLEVEFDAGSTYLFGGLVGSLDHGLANEAALASTTGATVWNINAFEPVALEYSRYNTNATIFYDGTTPYRASDHDPVLFGIDTTPLDDGQAQSTLSAVVTPTRIKVNKTRAWVRATVTSSDGAPVDDGILSVSAGDRVLGTATVTDGAANVRLPVFGSTGTKLLTVSYSDGTPADSSTTVPARVVKQKPALRVVLKPGTVVAAKTRPTVKAVLHATGQKVTGVVKVATQGRCWVVRVKDGVATRQLPTYSTAGRTRIKVVYLGDARNQRVAKTVTLWVRRG
ncbi:hypothetical protein BH18ACT9_BH18ACT9_17410 [soil metagenome]